ncbi:hypothetical protein KKP97_02940 [Methanothermococcus sp. SCGC AD-155-C09]|nr:hypothetical protein [Methanothermococcus sp. SCGC AD-155-C09]
MINNLLKLLLIIVIILMPLQVYGENPKVVKAWLGVYRYNGTYYDPLGNTFDGSSSFEGSDYIYTVINYQLSNGDIIRQVIKLNDNLGTTDPAATTVLYWNDKNWVVHNLPNQTVINKYESEIPVGSQIKISMADNYAGTAYGNGIWIVHISENGINFIEASQYGCYYHNVSFVFQNLNTNSIWEVQMPYKNKNTIASRVFYSGIIPFNGSNATIYNIHGDTPYAGKILQFAPPTELFKSSGGSASKSKEKTVEMDYQAEEAEKTIEDTKSTISQIKSKYNIKEAESLLSQAEEAFNKGDYSKAKELALNAKDTAIKIKEKAQTVDGIIKDAKSTISQIKSKYNIKEAESLLSQAEEAFNKGDYSKAKKTALEAKSLALDIDQDSIPNEEDFAPYINNYYIYSIIIAIILILAVNYYTSRKRKKEYDERKMKEFRSKVEKWKKEGYDVSELEEMLK